MATTLPLRQEIILGPDGKFIKRETRESVIADADSAIASCMRDDTLRMSNIPVSIPVLNKEYHCYYAHNSGINPEYVYAFVNLANGFPLPGAKFKPVEWHDSLYQLYIPPSRANDPQYTHQEPEGTVEPNDIPMYNNTDYAMFLMIRFPCRHLGTKRAKLHHYNEPAVSYLFGVHKESKNLITFNLPNIYDDGRLCGGSDFIDPKLCTAQEPIGYLQTAVTNLMKVLFESKCNRDLYYEERVNGHCLWYREGNDFATVPTSKMIDYNEEYKPASHFFQEITNSNLLDFASCLQSTIN